MSTLPADRAAGTTGSWTMMAGFSRLAPGAHIVPHRGYEGYLAMCYDCISGCRSRTAARCDFTEARGWKESECLVFDDSFEHEAWNRSDRTRTILLCDFLNPLRRRPLILNPKFTPELIDFIEREHIPKRGIGHRMLWHIWKLANLDLVRRARTNTAADRYAQDHRP